MFHLWLLSRYTLSWRRFFDVPIVLTVTGISLGVAVLVFAMSSFSGFETSLKKAIIEVVGDVTIYRRGGKITSPEAVLEDLKPLHKDLKESMMFLTQESLVVGSGKITAVAMQGVETEKAAKVLNLKSHILEGQMRWQTKEGEPAAFIGKDLARKMGLKAGDQARIIIPRPSSSSSTDIQPLIKMFEVAAIVDLGKYDFNSRFVFVDLAVLQDLVGSQQISGFNLRLKNSDLAPKWAERGQEILGWGYTVMDWRQTNSNYFSAIEYEKKVMFFVVLIIVIAACFNVATALFVTVLKRYRDISLMKTMGATPFDIVILFCMHGLFLGVLGLAIGLSLGIFICYFFEFLQKVFPLLPSDIYRLSFVSTEIRGYDLLMISSATLSICFLSTLIPSVRGSLLSPVEGLKYE